MPKRAGKTSDETPMAGKRYPLNMRTTFEVRQQLEEAAQQSGRSLAQEAESRIEQSFRDQKLVFDGLELAYGSELAGLMLVLGDVMKITAQHAGLFVAGDLAGQQWSQHSAIYDEVAKSALSIIDALRPEAHAEFDVDRLHPNPDTAKSQKEALVGCGQAYANARLELLQGRRAESGYSEARATIERRLLGRVLENLDTAASRALRKHWKIFAGDGDLEK